MRLSVIFTKTLIVFTLCNAVAQAMPVSIVPTALSAKQLTTFQFKSFREWKNGMILVAEAQAKHSKSALALKQRIAASAADPNMVKKQNLESGLSVHLEELQKQAEKDQYHLLITKELTISDYFVGYLTKQNDMKAAINEVSGRLTAEEIAELMAAYANNFFSSRPSSGMAPSRAGTSQ